MTKYYNYTFQYYFSEITISKAVTDNMEPRKMHKPAWASEWITQTLRDYTNDKYFPCALGFRLTEVSKGETVSLKSTFSAMDEAKNSFRAEMQR